MITVRWPFRDFDGFWAWLGRNSDQIKFILGFPSIIIAASIFLVEYYGKGVDERRKSALEFVHRYVQGDILSSRVRLRRAIIDKRYEEFVKKITFEQQVFTKIDKVSYLDERNLLGNVFVVAEYFEHVTICVYANLCDLGIVCEALYSDLKVFGNDYLFYIDDIRKRENRPAGRLGEFHQRFSNSQECFDNRSWTSKSFAAIKRAILFLGSYLCWTP